MKRIILLAVASMAFLGASAQNQWRSRAVNIEDAVAEYIENAGYSTRLEDGDLYFEVSGTEYFVDFYDKDSEGWHYLELVCIYNVNDSQFDHVAAAANDVNQGYKQVRVSFEFEQEGAFFAETPGFGSFAVRFDTPAYVQSAEEFTKLLFTKYVDCIDQGSESFFEHLEEYQQN